MLQQILCEYDETVKYCYLKGVAPRLARCPLEANFGTLSPEELQQQSQPLLCPGPGLHSHTACLTQLWHTLARTGQVLVVHIKKFAGPRGDTHAVADSSHPAKSRLKRQEQVQSVGKGPKTIAHWAAPSSPDTPAQCSAVSRQYAVTVAEKHASLPAKDSTPPKPRIQQTG